MHSPWADLGALKPCCTNQVPKKEFAHFEIVLLLELVLAELAERPAQRLSAVQQILHYVGLSLRGLLDYIATHFMQGQM